MCVLLVLCAKKTADVSPNPLQDEQEGQQVEEQRDSLEIGRGMDNRQVNEGNGKMMPTQGEIMVEEVRENLRV